MYTNAINMYTHLFTIHSLFMMNLPFKEKSYLWDLYISYIQTSWYNLQHLHCVYIYILIYYECISRKYSFMLLYKCLLDCFPRKKALALRNTGGFEKKSTPEMFQIIQRFELLNKISFIFNSWIGLISKMESLMSICEKKLSNGYEISFYSLFISI